MVGLAGFGCREKKKPSLLGADPVAVEDFMASFELATLSVSFNDSLLLRKEKDSSQISYSVFKQFVPDSILHQLSWRKTKPKIFPLRRVEIKNQESYLFVKLIDANQKMIVVLCFDQENRFLSAMPLLKLDDRVTTNQISGMDRKYSIFKTTFLKKADGSSGEGREVYVFSADAKQFILIMTDALDDKITEIINPIDTLPGKNKYSADYSKDKVNLVSVRDGIRAGSINFFIHFEKNAGNCIGELKGVARFTSSRTAIFRQAGVPCVLQLTFSTNSVSLKEIEACGSHRDVKCAFEGSFVRKKFKKK